MNRLLGALAALVLAAAGLSAAAPAHAGWPGGIVVHAADDGGYAGPFTVRCSSGAIKILYRGDRASCGDVDAIWDGYGFNVLCLHTDGRWQNFNRDGWTSIGDWFNAKCYHQVS